MRCLLERVVGSAPERAFGSFGRRAALDHPGRLGHNGHMRDDARRYAPSAARNRDAILKALSPHLPKFGRVLEIASGSGEHAMHLAAAHPKLTFQPSDPDPDGRASTDAWAHHLGLTNVAPAIALDVTQSVSPSVSADIVICINMIHIAPWSAAVGLMRNAAIVLPTGGLLYLYGPIRRSGEHTAPSNAAFDSDLRASNPTWGVRDLEAVATLASDYGFSAPNIEAMPANNFSLIFTRQ
jgi:SAM-dependent methyltransferase